MFGLSKYIVAASMAAHEVRIVETSTLTHPHEAGGVNPVSVAFNIVLKSLEAAPCCAYI